MQGAKETHSKDSQGDTEFGGEALPSSQPRWRRKTCTTQRQSPEEQQRNWFPTADMKDESTMMSESGCVDDRNITDCQ